MNSQKDPQQILDEIEDILNEYRKLKEKRTKLINELNLLEKENADILIDQINKLND